MHVNHTVTTLVCRPKSLFSQSFALRRVSPLEFNQVQHTPDGTPVYNQPIPQKRGGSVGFGGIYPIGGFGDEEHIEEDEGPPQESEGHPGQGGHFDGYSYDDFDYDEGPHGGPHGQQGGSSQADYDG